MRNRRRGLSRWLASALVASAIVSGTTDISARADDFENHGPNPYGIPWFSIRGLDVDNNRLDAILAAGGQSCAHDIYSYRRLCGAEADFIDFLKKLPPHLPEIATKLQALGAVCRSADDALTCIYEKHVNHRALQGAFLILEVDYFYTLELIIVYRNSEFEYYANLKRKVTPIYARYYSKPLGTK